jgi:hypothetical protein
VRLWAEIAGAAVSLGDEIDQDGMSFYHRGREDQIAKIAEIAKK